MSERPNPANIVECNLWIMDHIEALERARDEKRIIAVEAAVALGYAPRYFRGRAWRVPGFGLNGTMHSLSAWREWLDRPETERRAEWDAMSLKERRKIRGVA